MKWFGRKLRDAYRNTFDGPHGEAVLEDLYSFCGMGRSSHYTGDSHQTAYNEGMRRVFLEISRRMNTNEKQLAEIERENKRKQDEFNGGIQ